MILGTSVATGRPSLLPDDSPVTTVKISQPTPSLSGNYGK